MRRVLTPGLLAKVERRAHAVGLGADRVLVAAHLMTDEAYARAFARHHGIAFEPLTDVPRHACPIDDECLLQTPAAGLLPLYIDGQLTLVVAPQALGARGLIRHLEQRPHLRASFRVTSPKRLQQFMARHATGTLARHAAEWLHLKKPAWSAASTSRPPRTALAGAVVAAVAATALAPNLVALVVNAALAVVFLSWTLLRLIGACTPGALEPEQPPENDDALPIYTIIIALYREADAVEGLIQALVRLDYPPEKLDIKLALEPDDHETREAIAAMNLGPPFSVVIAPDHGPRTKPKALNAALPFARGTFTAVFDAEDRPEPDQLRRAVAAFNAADQRLACVQARLTIDNTRDSWLTRLFTAEYAGLFDVFLPGLATHHLPLPLGGSSNHFRTAVLREVGAWDPYNVTEDADLGMRLARVGYRSGVIASTTYEEAPARFGPWLKQRTRWFKGWMQTWLVHMRSPVALARDLGLSGFVAFQLLMGGTVLSALVHPIFAALFGYELISILWLGEAAKQSDVVSLSLFGATLAAGYGTSILLGAIGLQRRRLLSTVWALVLMPLHWLLLSLAAWRALVQLVHDPYRWEKTQHGIARTSRLAEQAKARPLRQI